MDKKDLKIVFMGTPDFAVESLKSLVENGFNIVGVVTMPDKPAGRGHKLQFSAVKQYAVSQGLRLMQPENLKALDFVDELRSLAADLQIVVAFRMLPEVVWGMPRLGTFNLHASLLPQYRGAAPINWAVMNGEKMTGITTFFLKHEIDTGEIIQQVAIPITEEDNAGTVHDKLMTLGAKLVVETVDDIISGNVHPKPQEELIEGKGLKSAPKIFKETCRIDWGADAMKIFNHIRGLSPYPAAWTLLCGEEDEPATVKIFASKVLLTSHNLRAGEIETDNKHFLRVAIADGFIEVLSLQLPGKKRLDVEDFLRGFNMSGRWFE